VDLWNQVLGEGPQIHIKINQHYQSKTLKRILNIPWYVSNKVTHADCKIPYVREEISKLSQSYQCKIENNQNYLALNLLENSQCTYRLKRHHILNLTHRFDYFPFIIYFFMLVSTMVFNQFMFCTYKIYLLFQL
jgi:hypothetical protein